MKKSLKSMSEQIDSLALKTVVLDAADIAGLGEVLRILETIGDSSTAYGETFTPLVKAMKSYLEKVILGEEKELAPFEQGISLLQELCRDLGRKKRKSIDVQPLLQRLGEQRPGENSGESAPQVTEPPMETSAESAAAASVKGSDQSAEKAPPVTEEDKQIIREFVAESLESLESIEVRLLDLDQDPKDGEAINAIFRPFHTIKGVSGFLNFTRINHLAHAVESLLDKARNKEMAIDGPIIDLILGSVDTLRKMIRNVDASLGAETPTEGEVETQPILDGVERLIAQVGGAKKPLGEILLQRGSVSQEDLDKALDKQKESRDKLGEILIEEDRVETREVLSALRDQKRASPVPAYQVKVDTLKLDSIVDMVGELAIAQTMLKQNELIKESADRKLYQITNQLSLIVSGLQSTAMSLRMIPIGSTFQKMLRIVRDLARKSGKDVRLQLSGEDTEIDRNMVDEIYEPLVHMIRNAMDHGIETPEERERAHKSRQGTIHLRAYYRGGDIVIEIEDDGRGLDRDKILRKALSLGLIREGDKLSERELNHLIFHPGFSTAEKVTDVSGRGVGTDVVMSKVQKLRGRVDVHSQPGQGTTFVIHLPLTLAIIDGIIIKAGGERYIIPTLNVQESFRLQQKDVFTVTGKGEVLKVRDNLIPLLHLRQLLGVEGSRPSEGNGSAASEQLAVVVESQEKKRCLLVDELLGKEEIVIKSLGGWLRNVRGIAGGAILGDGTVGLILDVTGLLDLAVQE
jgi:two-component system, chemotaxis family, sensor kinase CheA